MHKNTTLKQQIARTSEALLSLAAIYKTVGQL